MKQVQIIILAAGKGTRMQSDGPKALTLLDSKPFVNHIIDTVTAVALELSPIVVVGHQKERVIEQLGDVVRYAEQVEQLGTGHAVMSAHDASQTNQHDIVVVLYADHPLVSPATIQALIEKQQQTNAKIVMAPTIVPSFDGWYNTFEKWGRFKRGLHGEIVSIIEYKDATDEDKTISEVNPGYLVFDASWMWKHLKNLKNDNSQAEYYLTDLVKIAFEENELVKSVQIAPEEAAGANSREELAVLEELLAQKKKFQGIL
jgi:bifunctional UDP-N-acetylglucosamine pyrophosphorylase / glucosamine-1-phosphate N-acetyltransferase